MLEPISGTGLDGWKSLYACLLRAPLCGAKNVHVNLYPQIICLKLGRGGGSKVVWIISENSSALVGVGFP